MLDVPKSSLLKQPFNRFVFSEEQDNYYLHRKQLLASAEPQAYELRMLRPDGSIFWAWLEANLALDANGSPEFRLVLLDITEKKQLEAASRLEPEQRYQALLNHAGEGIILLSPAGHLIDVNNAFAQMHGYSLQEIRQLSLQDLNTPDSFSPLPERLIRFEAGETLVFEVEHKHKDGHIFPLEVTAQLISSDGKAYIQAFHRDISERKQAAAEIQRSLQEKNVMLKEIHHRVKNNLQVAFSLLSLQARQVTDPIYSAMFEESKNRILSMALIHQTLYQTTDLAHIDFKTYLQGLVGSIKASYHSPQVTVVVDMAARELDIKAGIPCGLIVNELVSNSLKYAFPDDRVGTITLGICPDSEGNNVLTVADNGIGFPTEIDFRNHSSSLGLQLVNVLTDQIRGTIELSRATGTCFSITFPATG